MREDLRETSEQLIQAGVQRDRHALRIQQLAASRPATADGSAVPIDANQTIEGDAGSDDQIGVIEQHLTRQVHSLHLACTWTFIVVQFGLVYAVPTRVLDNLQGHAAAWQFRGE